jgi:GAF domain-containing protein
MTTDPRPPHEGQPADPRAHASEPMTHEGVMADLASIEVAHEELRVAEEEMRVQSEQITQLLLQHDAERRWRGQMSALIPIGLCVTDGNGALVEANPALAAHLGTALPRLRGKPLSVYLSPGDVKQFRAALGALSGGTSTEHRLSLAVLPRNGRPQRTHLFGFTETADKHPSTARVQWVLVPEELSAGAEDDEASAEPAATPEPAAALEEMGQPVSATELIGLATSLSEFSALPVGDYDRQRLLGRMASLVRGAVPGADWVSITMGSPAEPQRLGSDSAEAQRFDGQQLKERQGPCLDAYESGSAVLTDDVTTDARWPALAAVARTGAVRSVLAVPIQEDGTTTGAVNVYSGRVGAFGGAGRRIAELTAASVASVLQNVSERESMQHLAENLERALTSRSVIDQAKGVIMAHLGVNADDAFARMVNLSNRLNVKLRDLAALITEGHVDAILRAAE